MLVWAEMGIGDQIMFAVLLGDLLALGARVLVQLDERLEPLLVRSFPQIRLVRPQETAYDLVRIDYQEAGMVRFPSPDCWWSINRTPLSPGWVTESMDGRPVAPLMGDYPSHDVGTLRMRTMPNFWNHASSDHAVTTRLAPAGPGTTLTQVQWLVHQDAVEGKDYELDTLMPFWGLTSEQDWELCARNQAASAAATAASCSSASVGSTKGWPRRSVRIRSSQVV